MFGLSPIKYAKSFASGGGKEVQLFTLSKSPPSVPDHGTLAATIISSAGWLPLVPCLVDANLVQPWAVASVGIKNTKRNTPARRCMASITKPLISTVTSSLSTPTLKSTSGTLVSA